MAAANRFMSIPFRRVTPGDLDISTITVGSSTTATDFFEFRYMTADASAVATGVIRDDALLALEAFRNFILGGGTDGNGTGVPPTSL